jgi:hypothetical protein
MTEQRRTDQMSIRMTSSTRAMIHKLSKDEGKAIADIIDLAILRYAFREQPLLLTALHTQLAKAVDDARDTSALREHKTVYSNAAEREVDRLSEVIEFERLGVDIKYAGRPGLYLVEEKYEIAPRNRRWRRIGKGTWYHYKTPTQFKDRFIDRN